MDTEIICTIIQTVGTLFQALGTVGAAIGAALIARKAVKEDIKPIFQTYSDKTHNVSDIIEKAEHNIVIFTVSGNTLLKKYRYAIEERLKCGVSVYYLLLNEQRLLEMDKYMHGDDIKNENIYSWVMGQLEELNKSYPGKIQSREFPYFMTASYIGIDIPFDDESNSHFPDSVIQVMQYQYRRRARFSPIAYFSFKQDRDQFDGTVASMIKMWDASTELFPADLRGRNMDA